MLNVSHQFLWHNQATMEDKIYFILHSMVSESLLHHLPACHERVLDYRGVSCKCWQVPECERLLWPSHLG